MSATTHAREPIENATEERKAPHLGQGDGAEPATSGDGAAAEKGSRGVGAQDRATPRTRNVQHAPQ